MVKPKPILLFADRLPPLIGGVESHAGAFINHFNGHSIFPLLDVVTKDQQGKDRLLKYGKFETLPCPPQILFFNSGRWIEEMEGLKSTFQRGRWFYRTGGNEILKAPLETRPIISHTKRQAFWARVLNQTAEGMVTNSAFTERRLRQIGITLPFHRVVGGVDPELLQRREKIANKIPTLFCAARFVPYKNHAILIQLISRLKSQRVVCTLRLAGDGPLKAQLEEAAKRANVKELIHFLGPLSPKATCEEIAHADLYVQLSVDQETLVLGGSYQHSEGMGRTILEAITAGTYIVAGHSGALSEIVTGQRGMLVDPFDLDALHETIIHLLSHPPRKGPFTDEFSWSYIFNQYEEIWNQRF